MGLEPTATDLKANALSVAPGTHMSKHFRPQSLVVQSTQNWLLYLATKDTIPSHSPWSPESAGGISLRHLPSRGTSPEPTDTHLLYIVPGLAMPALVLASLRYLSSLRAWATVAPSCITAVIARQILSGCSCW